jgi:hypothetical protein
MHRAAMLAPMFGLLAGCSSTPGHYPSLQPRAAEQIDPRLPITRPMNDRPVNPALAARLDAMVSAAQSGNVTFDAAASEAERLAASAGAPQSDGWIAAQEALSGALAARKPVAMALADIDAFAANALQTQGGIAPNDLAAIQNAASVVGDLDRRQAERVKAIQARLGD